MKYLTQREQELDEQLQKKSAECSELYDMVDSKTNKLAECVAEINEYEIQLQEAKQLLKEALEVLSDFNSEPEDKVRTFLNKIENK